MKDKDITSEDIKRAIIVAGAEYSKHIMEYRSSLGEEDIQAAYLCGMAALSQLLAKHDGSATVTAANLYSAVAKVAKSCGFQLSRANDTGASK